MNELGADMGWVDMVGATVFDYVRRQWVAMLWKTPASGSAVYESFLQDETKSLSSLAGRSAYNGSNGKTVDSLIASIAGNVSALPSFATPIVSSAMTIRPA